LAQSSLDWSAPPECDRRDELNELVLRLTGKSLDEQTVPSSFRVVIERAHATPESGNVSEGWVLSLTVQREQETLSRRIEGEDCAGVTRAAASALALILGQNAEPEGAPAEAAQNTEPPDEASATPTAATENARSEVQPESRPSAPEPSSESEDSWRWGARLGGGVDANLFPEATGIVQGALHGARSGLRLELVGSLFPARHFTFAAGAVNVSLAAGGLRVCRDAGAVSWMFLPCIDFEAGKLEAWGADDGSRSSALWLTAGATFLGGYKLSRDYALLLEVPVRVPLEKHQVRLGGTTVVHELPSIDVRALLGFEATWP
jgi:hypothetical protein